MGTRLTIRWTSAARFAGIGVGAIAALTVLAGALEPPSPAPLPADLGLELRASSPPAPSSDGEGRRRVEPKPGRRDASPAAEHPKRAARSRRDSRQTDRPPSDGDDRARTPQHPAPAEAPTHPPAPPPVSAPPPTPVAPAPPPESSPPAPPTPAPARDPVEAEFGFEP